MLSTVIEGIVQTLRRSRPLLAAAVGIAVTSGLALAANDAQDGTGPQKPKLAFVIGNQAYQHLTVEDLRNPVNDGKLMARTLRRLNFEVVEGYDLTRAELLALFADNRGRIAGAEAVVLYYAGHGFQLEGKNYVVPVDAALTSVGDIPLQTVQLNAIVSELEDPNRPTLLFMDACRENPLPPSVDTDVLDGLAQIEAGTNTFIAFSTEPGKVSYGGSGNNSPFAVALATHLETPGQSVSDLMIAVRNETQELTLKRQTPWTQESLLAQFYFTDRQQLDPEALKMAAAEILNDPRQLEAFLKARDEEGLSFLPAVFRARQRAVTVLGQPAPPNTDDLYAAPPSPSNPAEQPADSIAIASAPPANVESEDEPDAAVQTLMFARLNDAEEPVVSAPPAAPDRRLLARKLQTELQRLGCYRMSIDGLWGRGSRAALRRYLQATKQSVGALQPTVPLLNRTMLDSGRICREPVIIKRKPAVNVAKRTSPRQQVRQRQRPRKALPSIRRRAAQGQTRQAQQARRTQRRQALPPDLRMGVGIGF
ncbi:MAG: caspase family protein [Pseudomonadota bacterium]